MFKFVAVVAAIAAFPAIAMSSERNARIQPVTHAQKVAAAGTCQRGDITVRRLSDPACLALIETPTPRPDPEVAEIAPTIIKPVPTFDYVEIAGNVPGEVRRIRLVGPRFLPPRDEGMDLKRAVTVQNDPLNAVFQSVVSALGVGVTPAVADEQEASSSPAPTKGARLSQLAAVADTRL